MARRIDESCRNSEGALLHRFPNHVLHLLEFFRRRGPIRIAQDCFTNLGRTYVGADVQRRARFLKPVEVAVETGPVHGQVVLSECGCETRQCGVILRRNRCAFACDLSGDALGQLAERPVVDQQRHFGLPQHVNETRGDDQTRSINRAFRRGSTQISACRNPLTFNRDVTRNPGIPRAIDDSPIANDYVIRGVSRIRRRPQWGAIGCTRNLAQSFARHSLHRFRIVLGNRNHVDVEREGEMLSLGGFHVPCKALTRNHEVVVQGVADIIGSGFREYMSGCGRIHLDLIERSITPHDRQPSPKIREVFLLRHEKQVTNHEVRCEEGVAAGAIALRGCG